MNSADSWLVLYEGGGSLTIRSIVVEAATPECAVTAFRNQAPAWSSVLAVVRKDQLDQIATILFGGALARADLAKFANAIARSEDC